MIFYSIVFLNKWFYLVFVLDTDVKNLQMQSDMKNRGCCEIFLQYVFIQTNY